MVYRIYVEKKPEHAVEAGRYLSDIHSFLGVAGITGLRFFNRYDVEGVQADKLPDYVRTIFSEPQLDDVYEHLPAGGDRVFATEYLPGQYDQRADSAAQCIQIASEGERPTVRTAKVYMMTGAISDAEYAAICKYLMNPVESREASLDRVDTLEMVTDRPTSVQTLTGFTGLDDAGLAAFIRTYALAMDLGDIQCCRDYFAAEKRDPTITEIRMLDTYWSDHCRHTTFSTILDDVSIADVDVQKAYDRYLSVRAKLGRTKPVTLMDIATIGAKALRAQGLLTDEDESEEINACTVKIDVDVDGRTEKWLLLFKNETHNHPTEIEPFGGAATCIGGAIRDPLSGRSYVYQAMRVTGAADPLRPVSETLPGKLPQRKLTTTAAAGYSSYGNQIGLATGIVDEIYHPGYAAKRMEIGAVIGATPRENVRRETPEKGDVVILLGGRTGRDGCGGATGSSKSHNLSSLEKCGAEVQKGNAPEERKLQRLFRNPATTRLIKRCNDFGAGGVSVAIGELADGLDIDLNAVPRKYDGLDGTELAISESQERMAVVVAPADAAVFISLAQTENIEATRVASVTDTGRLTMTWNGKQIVNIARSFIDLNGAKKHMRVAVGAGQKDAVAAPADFASALKALAGDLNICSRRGLAERFDSTIGARTVLMPFGGKFQRTPIQAMVGKIPVQRGETRTCSAMAWGGNPYVMEKNPYRGAYLAVVESLSKLVACGAGVDDAHLTFQEYFERLGTAPERWGKPFAALLGALDAQLDFSVAAIGGKDSMSGSFENLDVPPTLVSFAVSTGCTTDIISPEFKCGGHRVYYLAPQVRENGLPDAADARRIFAQVTQLISAKKVVSAWTDSMGGAMEGVLKMTLGNRVGFAFAEGVRPADVFARHTGAFILEAAEEIAGLPLLGSTLDAPEIRMGDACVSLADLERIYEGKLDGVFPAETEADERHVPAYNYRVGARIQRAAHIACPRVLIPVFPGTNCEYDAEAAFVRAGASVETLVIRNLTGADVRASVERFAQLIDESQIIFIPGGFSGGDEPDGSAKFITAFFRNPMIAEKVETLLYARDGLMGGICNGFQALIKLGLVPYGHIETPRADSPTLSFNRIGRHQSKLVTTRVASNLSPWLMYANVGDLQQIPISHGEGRFVADDETMAKLAANGQIATQYASLAGVPSMDSCVNPNGSRDAVEGITSPDGRVLGKMGHSERWGENLYRNVPGPDGSSLFAGAVDYFRK